MSLVTGLYDVKLYMIISPSRFLHQYLVKQTADGAAKSCSFWEIEEIDKSTKTEKKKKWPYSFPKKSSVKF